MSKIFMPREVRISEGAICRPDRAQVAFVQTSVPGDLAAF
jgi:hypothetical protein